MIPLYENYSLQNWKKIFSLMSFNFIFQHCRKFRSAQEAHRDLLTASLSYTQENVCPSSTAERHTISRQIPRMGGDGGLGPLARQEQSRRQQLHPAAVVS